MRRTTAGIALLLAAAVPAVVALTSASPAPPAVAPTSAYPATVVAAPASLVTAAAPAAALPMLGPTPSSWEGGHAVAVAPRWWPRGYHYASAPWPALWPKPVAFSPTRTGPLRGVVIAIDPGHDIGNGSHVSLINRKYWVGLTKICNTTGTATNAGYPEATFVFDVAARLRRLLTAAGATVVVTRDRNSRSAYGPCVGARGSFPAQEHARLMVSLHGDGGPSTGRGFHVIVPGNYVGYTDDIYRRSMVLGKSLIAGMSASFHRATYLSSPLSIRKDQGTLNMSNVPTAIVETLNMRNRYDAAIAMSTTGRQRIAAALYAGIVRYLRTA
ncbi:MAG: N-acetylmuramoyl-L-alanine amidase [Actinomycetales bacterium]|nr:N-acetylmuramoyl-L-alanine amidase [Actinomycetales bacterium]